MLINPSYFSSAFFSDNMKASHSEDEKMEEDVSGKEETEGLKHINLVRIDRLTTRPPTALERAKYFTLSNSIHKNNKW